MQNVIDHLEPHCFPALATNPGVLSTSQGSQSCFPTIPTWPLDESSLTSSLDRSYRLGQSTRTFSLGQSRWLQVMAGHTDSASRLVHTDFKSWLVPSTSKSQ
ncbi:hypothetical protein B296_00022232 [Ensete ventricosum]|uniref:Uncharacterized protein n=1 Tax=Ensete ventricosum TaxID=4639 RepID=A0A426XKI3_ENSVE|nr:hypothetical protein B296_00022232 [Ensete ventricosum]